VTKIKTLINIEDYKLVYRSILSPRKKAVGCHFRTSQKPTQRNKWARKTQIIGVDLRVTESQAHSSQVITQNIWFSSNTGGGR